MPTSGVAKYPYPAANVVPDVPLYIKELADRVAKMAGAGIGYAADATALAALISNSDAFTGLTVYVDSADAVVRYNGSGFKLVGTKRFADATARGTWTTTFSGLLEAGSVARDTDTGITYRWNGSAWEPVITAKACSLRKSGNYNLTTSAVALTWDVEISDPDGMHDNSSNTSRITAPVSGLYQVAVQLYNNNTSGYGTVYGRVNGTTDVAASSVRRTGDANVGTPLTSTFPVALSAGDYIEIMVLHSSAAGQIVGGTSINASAVTVSLIEAS